MIKIIWICVSVDVGFTNLSDGTVESIGIVIVVIVSTATFLVDPKSTLELIVVVLSLESLLSHADEYENYDWARYGNDQGH